MSRLLAIAIATALLPGIAVAQGVPAYDWTGVYLGAQGGWQWHHDDFEDPIGAVSGDANFDGAILGGHIGADRQFGRLVLGVVGDLEWADGSGDEVAENDPTVFGRAEANWQGSVRGRLGAAFDRVMVYGTGGLAFANYDFDYAFPGPPPPFGIGDQFNDTVLGYVIGGGAAVAAFSSWQIWVDYRFTDYETASSDIANCCAPPPNGQEHDAQTHAMRVGISRKFGGVNP